MIFRNTFILEIFFDLKLWNEIASETPMIKINLEKLPGVYLNIIVL